MPRYHCFTLHDYTEDDINQIKRWKYNYLVFGKEICPTTNRKHLQGYVEWISDKRFGSLKNLHPKIHWETRMGTAPQAAVYCKKDNDFWEDGDISSKGIRTDLTDIFDRIKAGIPTEIIRHENPIAYHMYGRTMEKLEDDYLRQKHRDFLTEGIWIWGPTGVGKSHRAFTETEGTLYIWKDDHGWWDGYKQQDTVIINEFRGQIVYSELLTLIDKWPTHVRRRNREPMPFRSLKIIITSVLPPQDVYKNVNEKDSIQQLLRRLTIIYLHEKPQISVIPKNDVRECTPR